MTKKTNQFSPEVRQRAIRMVLDHEAEYPSRWAAVSSIAGKIRCSQATLHEGVKKAEFDSGGRAGLASDAVEKMKAVERENRELRQANDISRKASAYFAMATRADLQALADCPSIYYENVAKRLDVDRLSVPSRSDIGIKMEIRRAFKRTPRSKACVKSGGSYNGQATASPTARSLVL